MSTSWNYRNSHFHFPIYLFNIFNLRRNYIKAKYRLTLSMWDGQLDPVASTGISSYFSKLIPVLLPEKSSLKKKKIYNKLRQVQLKKKKKFKWTILLLQALIASSGFGPVIILGLICPARISPTRKTSTLKSKQMHIQCVNKILYRLCAWHWSSRTDLIHVRSKLFQLTFLLILHHGHWRTWIDQNVLQSCCRQDPSEVLSSCFLCCHNCQILSLRRSSKWDLRFTSQ